MQIHVLGGGISGLNLARELSNNTSKVILYESSQNYGGLAGYVHKFGRNLDLGPHIFHSPDKDIADYIKSNFS